MRKEIFENSVLYCGDCREIIDDLTFDCIICDPPYGLSKIINKKWECMETNLYVKRKRRGENWKPNDVYAHVDWDNEAPDLTFLLERKVPTMIFGGNYFSLPPSRKWIVWDKGGTHYRRSFAECELCYCSFDGNARIVKSKPVGMGFGKNAKIHPTQKPVDVMQFCISELPEGCGNIICDPYMGSGSTGVACINMGRSFIGIEQSTKYFDLTCKRIEEAYAKYKHQFPVVQEMIESKKFFNKSTVNAP